MDKQEVVNCIRKFNRFYTVLLGFLNQNYLGTGYSVTETRILFEISRQEGISAKQLCELLKLDKGYMSRIIRSFEQNGILYREVSASDKRTNCIYLTDQGRTAVTGLIETTNRDIYQLIDNVDIDVCEQICNAMELISDKFSEVSGEGTDSNIVIRTCRPGDPSRVVHFYYKLFEQQFDFRPNVENYFLHAMTELFDHPNGSELWLAEENGKIVGSVCIVGKEGGNAQLRLFGTAPSIQGKGIGKMLMQKAMDFCKEKGYSHVILWTIDICRAARHLYSKFGFRLTDTKLNTIWADYEMTEEKWEYEET